MRRWWSGLIAGAVIGTCGAVLTVTPLGSDMEKRFGLPWLFAQRGPVEPPPDIAIVAIDSTTWASSRPAQAAARLAAHDARQTCS